MARHQLCIIIMIIIIMGPETVTAGVSRQDTIENGAHCGKRWLLTLGWKTKRSIQQLYWI